MNKKGFTMVELLGVIVLLTIVLGLAVFSVTSIINNGKKGVYSGYEQQFKTSVQNYINDYPDKLLYEDGNTKIYLTDVIENGYLSALQDPNGGNCNNADNDSYVLIQRIVDDKGKYKFNYKSCLICKIGNNIVYTSTDCESETESTMYAITYNLNGGVANNPTSYRTDTNSFTLNQPTKLGYVFIGWTGSNGSTPLKNVTINKGSSGDKNYIANWSPNELNFSGITINRTYGDATSDATFTGASNGTGSYTYTEKSEKNSSGASTNYISVSGTKITVLNSIPAGTYTYVVTAKDNNLLVTKDATFTINVAKKYPTMTLSSNSGSITCEDSITITVTTDGDGTIGCSTSDDIAACSVSGKTVTMSRNPKYDKYSYAAPYTTVTISQAAGSNYTSASKKYAFAIFFCPKWRNIYTYLNDCAGLCPERCLSSRWKGIAWACMPNESTPPSSDSVVSGHSCWCKI